MDVYDVSDVVGIMPDLRQVQFQVKTAEGQYASYQLNYARRKNMGMSLTAVGNAKIKERHAVWQLWATDLAAAGLTRAPKAGDRIVDGSETWVVDGEQDEDHPLIRQVWNLPCVKLPT